MNDIEVRFPGLLDAELNESERLSPLAASLTLNLYGSSEATITLPEDAPYIRIHDWVSLYTQNGFAGIFRVTNISRNFKRNLEITLLHGIDILSDSVWSGQEKFSGNMTQFLTAALNHQTHLVNGVKPWVLGVCEDSSTTFTDKEMNYDRLSTLLEGLIEEGGDYYYEYNMATFPWTLNVRRKSSVVWSEFRLSRNVTTANVTYNDADLCTRLIVSVNNKTTEERGDYSVPSETVYPDQSAHGLIPDSSKAPGSTAEVTSNETTIRTYDSESGQRNWGIVVKTADIDLAEIRQTWPSVDAWAANFMGLRSQPSVQIQIDGEELAQLSGDNWDELALGRNCRVCLPTYSPGYFNERVVSVTYPDLFSRPSHVTVSLANALPKFSESITRIADKADSAASSARSAGRYAASAEELTQWSQIVEYYGEALDGTGVMTLYRSGIEMDAATGLKIYSLSQGVQSLYSGISVNTEGIESLVTKTGVNDLGQGESLYSKITQTAGQIQSVVSQTGVVAEEFDPNKSYAKGARVLHEGVAYEFKAAHTGPWTGTDVRTVGSLQSQIDQRAEEVSSIVTKTGVNELGQSETLYSKITQTESSLSSRIGDVEDDVETHYSLITQTSDKVGMVVVTQKAQDGTTSNKINVAGIVTAINNDNTTETVIQANKIALRTDGSLVKLSERVVIETDGYTKIKGLLKVASGSTGSERSVDINYGNITAYDISIKAGYSITFIGAAAGERYPFDTDRAATLYNLTSTAGKKAVIDVQISGPDNNIYTLQKKYVGDSNFTDAGTFSRATTLSGTWSGSEFVVSASPQGNTRTITFDTSKSDITTYPDYNVWAVQTGTPSAVDNQEKWIQVPIEIGSYSPNQQMTVRYTVNKQVNASLAYENGEAHGKTLVTLTDPAINAHTGSTLPVSRNFTVKTSGRGSGNELSETIYVKLELSGTKVGLKWHGGQSTDPYATAPVAEYDVSSLVTARSVESADPMTLTASDIGANGTSGNDTGSRSNAALTISKSISFTYDDDDDNTDSVPVTINAKAIYDQGCYDGWDKARLKNKIPTEQASSLSNITNHFQIQVPSSQYNQSVYYNYAIDTGTEGANGTYYAYLRYSDADGSPKPIVARSNIHSVYTAGVSDGDTIGYDRGVRAVSPTNAVLSNTTRDSSTGGVTASLTVSYTGNKTKTFNNVNVKSIYDAGFASRTETNSYPATFDITMSDGDDFSRVVQLSVDCSDAYNAGARDAAPTDYGYRYVYGGTLIIRSGPGANYSRVASVATGAYLHLLEDWDNTAHSGWILIEYSYGGLYATGYVSKTWLTTSNPGGNGGWVVKPDSGSASGDPDYPYNGTVYVNADDGYYAIIYTSESVNSTIVTSVQTGEGILCKDVPSGYSGEWMHVKYNDSEGYIRAKFVVGTDAYRDYAAGSGEVTISTVTVNGVAHQAQYYNGSFPITIQPKYPNSSGQYRQSVNSFVPTSGYSNYGINADGNGNMSDYFEKVYSNWYATNSTQSNMGPSDDECAHRMVVTVVMSDGSSYSRLLTFNSKYR